MNFLSRATDELLKAETQLRQLISDAANAGDYDSVAVLVGWATKLSHLASEPAANPSVAKAESEMAERNSSKPSISKQPSVSASSRKKRSKKKYPKFAKSNDTLVKIAWSKKNKSEYKHRSPKAILSLLVAAFLSKSSDGPVVSMESILPLKSDSDGEIPSYQTYLCLAWLKGIGIVSQHGREGYSINNVDDFEGRVEESWSNLPSDK